MAFDYTSVKEVYNQLTALANSIRSKAGATGTCTLDRMKELVDGIKLGADTSGVTATAGDILAGKKTYNSAGELMTGTMPDNGTVSKVLSRTSTSYTIPEGYHNGSGKVYIETEDVTVAPSTSTQTIYPSTNRVFGTVTVSGTSDMSPTGVYMNNCNFSNYGTKFIYENFDYREYERLFTFRYSEYNSSTQTSKVHYITPPKNCIIYFIGNYDMIPISDFLEMSFIKMRIGEDDMGGFSAIPEETYACARSTNNYELFTGWEIEGMSKYVDGFIMQNDLYLSNYTQYPFNTYELFWPVICIDLGCS